MDEPVAVDDFDRRGARGDGAGGGRVVLSDAKVFAGWVSADSAGFIFTRDSRRPARH